VPETIDGALYRRKAFLLGFMTKAEADGLFAMNPLRVPGGATPAAVSQAARAARTGLGGYVPGTADPIPAALSALVDEIRSRNVYKKEYEAKADYEFRTVPIDSLLTPQTEADLDYVDELAGSLTDSPDDNKDFAFAFPTAQIAEPITVGNTLTFTSNAPNIAVTPVPIVRRTQDGFDVVMEARARPNYVMVARVAGRMVLHNGVHKVLALKKRSRARVFALVYDVQNVAQLQLPGAQSSTFLDANYIQAARPPLVIDLLGPTATPTFMRATIFIYQLSVQFGQAIAPAPASEAAQSAETSKVGQEKEATN